MVTKRSTSGGQYHQHGCVSREWTPSSVDVRCPEKALSKVRWRCSMKTTEGQNVIHSGTLNQWSSRSNAMGLCNLTTSVRKPNRWQHSRRTATSLAAGQRY